MTRTPDLFSPAILLLGIYLMDAQALARNNMDIAEQHLFQQQKLESMMPQGGGRQLCSKKSVPVYPDRRLSVSCTSKRGGKGRTVHSVRSGYERVHRMCFSTLRRGARHSLPDAPHLPPGRRPGEGATGKKLCALTFRLKGQVTFSKA